MMITYLKRLLTWIALSVLMTIFWIIGLMIGNSIFPSSLIDTQEDPGSHGELMLLLTCAINTGVLMIFIRQSILKRWRLIFTIAIVVFGIQFFMSQIETLWFNDSLNFPVQGIWAIMSGGAIMSFLFALTATWITGNFKGEITATTNFQFEQRALLIRKIAFTAAIYWPLIYFAAGYLIAWQFEEVRQFYSGSTVMASFTSIMIGNFTSGLYFFQILRGLLWILIAVLVLMSIRGNTIQKGIVLGLLLSFLGSSQLLLPNPYMSETVRIAHLIETASSSFIWGIILAYSFNTFVKMESQTN